jgi:hypothetical protein
MSNGAAETPAPPARLSDARGRRALALSLGLATALSLLGVARFVDASFFANAITVSWRARDPAAVRHCEQCVAFPQPAETALHVVAAQSPMTCPLVEYLIPKMSSYYHFEQWNPAPANGRITLPETPGFGIAIDEAKVEKRTAVTW